MAKAQTVARSIFWTFMEGVGSSLLSVVMFLLLARVLGPTDFGTAALALSIVQLAQVMPDTLFREAVVQRRDLRPEHVNSAHACSLLLGLAIAVALWLAAPAIAQWLAIPQVGPLVRWMTPSVVFTGMGAVPTALLYRSYNFRTMALRNMAARFIAAAAALTMAFSGMGVWSFAAQQLLTAGLSALALLAIPAFRPGLTLSWSAAGDLARFALISVSGHITYHAGGRLFMVLVGKLFNAEVVAYLHMSMRLLDTVGGVLTSGAMRVTLPLFSERQIDPSTLRSVYLTASELTIAATMPIFVGLCLEARPLLHLLVGREWMGAVETLQILSVGTALTFLGLHVGNALYAIGRPSVNLLGMVVGALASLGSLALFHDYGVLVVAVAFALRSLAPLPVGFWVLGRATGISLSDEVKVAAGPVAATLSMVLLIKVADATVFGGLPEVAALAAAILLGGVTYAAVLCLIRWTLVTRIVSYVAAAF